MAGPGRLAPLDAMPPPPRRRRRRCSASPSLLAWTAALALALAAFTPPTSALSLSLPSFLKPKPNTATEDALIQWVKTNGGTSTVRVGPIPGRNGLRGMIATAAVPKGSPLVILPSNLSVPMGTAEYTTPENLMVLLAQRAADPAWYAGHALYWASWPNIGSVFTKETFTAADLEELQDEDLAETATREQAWIERVYRGQQGAHGVAELADLQALAAGANVTFEEFQHASAVVASYAFLLPDDANVVRRVLLPLLDLINHANDDVANAVVGREGGAFVARAIKDIAVGEEVQFSYSNGNARNDHALQHYGFVNRDRAADPLLCCVDEPGGDLWNCPEPGAGLLASADKMNEKEREAAAQRLELILDAMKSTEAEDEAILAGLPPRDWRRATLVEFRILRKRALRRGIAKLRGQDPETAPLRDFGKKGGGGDHSEL